jgi:hypothetical protein
MDAASPCFAAQQAIGRECAAIAADLDRLAALIRDAGDRLAESFAVIGEAVPQIAGEGPGGTRVGRAVAAAVTALQFQDMATQLTQHAQRRLAILQDALRRLALEQDDPLQANTRMQPVRQAGVSAGSIDLF